MRLTMVFLILCATLTQAVMGGEDHSPDGISGSLIIVGGGSVPKGVGELLKQASGNGSVVVLSEAASDPKAAADDASSWLLENNISDVRVVGFELSEEVRRNEIVAAIRGSSCVWIGGGSQSRLAETFSGSSVETALQELLSRGGTIAGTSAGAAILSKVMIASGRSEPEIKTGWDLLPGVIIDQHFTQRDRQGRLALAVQQHPGLFGLGIDEGTAVLVRGRTIRVIGEGSVTVQLASAGYREAEAVTLNARSVADLTQLRRAARQRSSGVDPGLPDPRLSGPGLSAGSGPRVDHGALVIVGGGGMPKDVVDRFIELAGGEKARIVVLPTAVPRGETSTEVPGFFRNQKVDRITVLPQRGDEVNSAEFQTALKEATAVWFGGGRQWNFVDSYEGTNAVELFQDVLRRGGVIGGSSAGATIQGEFLVRGHPLGNTVMMAEGYECGFAFLPGSAIDQHFAQRGRHSDLIRVIQRHPKLLGIGIDESTAIVVTGTKVEVLGQHAAHFLTAANLQPLSDDPQLLEDAAKAVSLYTTMESGKTLDLSELIATE